MRKHPVDTINLEIIGIIPFYHSNENNGFVIEWDSDIGFGQYIIYKTRMALSRTPSIWILMKIKILLKNLCDFLLKI